MATSFLIYSSLRVDATCKIQISLAFASLAEKESKLFQVNTETSGAGILPVNAVYKKSFPAQESQRQTDPKKNGRRAVFSVWLSLTFGRQVQQCCIYV